MSTVVRPQGRLPARVYWVRRLLLVALVLLLVWGVTRLVGGGDDPSSADPSPAAADPDADATDADQNPDDTASPDETGDRPGRRADRSDERPGRRGERRRDRPERAPEPVQRTVTAALGAPAAACDLTQVQVEPSVPAGQDAGGPVAVRLALRTAQADACRLDLDTERLLLSVVDADGTVWSSSRCRDAIDSTSVSLRPAWTTTVTQIWPGRDTGQRCLDRASYASAGEYDLLAAVLTGEPAEAGFRLDEPPPPPEPDPQPDRPGDGAAQQDDEEQTGPDQDGQEQDGQEQDGQEQDGQEQDGQDGPDAQGQDGQGGGVTEPGDEALDDP